MSTSIKAGILALASTALAGSIADIEHVVIFMQENRAFDHYFGTMAGVRNFKDPNVHYDGNTPVWYQNVDAKLSTATDTLLPWYLNYLGGEWYGATECMIAGSNGWSANHDALNNGSNNMWAIGNTPWSWAHFTRKELPNHFAIAEGYTVGDMYQESVIASTNPNRVTWLSGTINAPGAPPGNPNVNGGVYIDNNENPGCESSGLNCYPLKWKTTPEYYQDAGVSWQVFQDTDNFDDNPLAWFQQYQTAENGTALYERGMTFVGLESFYAACAAGKLPRVSIIVGPAELSEHPPYTPRDGGWLQQRVVDAVTQSPAYAQTALIISYDETGGWGDHVVPYTAPQGTTGEYLEDPYNNYGDVPTGPGFRLPFYIISPWTRGGNVFVEHADHNSQIKFIETWLAAKGYNVTTAEMDAWRRAHMSDLTKAFDFDHPDYTIPSMPNISYPSTDSEGNWNGYAVCEAEYATTRPPVPYGQQNATGALATEHGFKKVRGAPSEGRYLTFEHGGWALTSGAGAAGKLSASPATPAHDARAQRFVLHQVGAQGNANGNFTLTSVASGAAVNGGAAYTIADLGNGAGYTLRDAATGSFLTVDAFGNVDAENAAWSAWTAGSEGAAAWSAFTLYSVSYDN